MEDQFFDEILERMGVKSENDFTDSVMKEKLKAKIMEVTMKAFYACVSDEELEHFEEFSDEHRRKGPVSNENIVLEFMAMYEELSLKVLEVVDLYLESLVSSEG